MKLQISIVYYANTPMQYTAIFHGCKNDNFQMIFFYIFLIFAQNIDCGYTLEQRGGSNEYPQSMFWNKNKKNMYTRVNPTFSIYKWGVRGCSLHGHVILMGTYFDEAGDSAVT